MQTAQKHAWRVANRVGDHRPLGQFEIEGNLNQLFWDVEELNSFALAMIQADVFGVSIASVLRTQASQLRIKRRQTAEAKAQQTPVKIVFPLILCVLPALFVIIIGPGAIRITQNLFH